MKMRTNILRKVFFLLSIFKGKGEKYFCCCYQYFGGNISAPAINILTNILLSPIGDRNTPFFSSSFLCTVLNSHTLILFCQNQFFYLFFVQYHFYFVKISLFSFSLYSIHFQRSSSDPNIFNQSITLWVKNSFQNVE